MVRAAVLTEVGGALRVTDLELPDPGPVLVRVRIAATGVCHSDLSLARGTLAQPVPAVLGHEVAGTKWPARSPRSATVSTRCPSGTAL